MAMREEMVEGLVFLLKPDRGFGGIYGLAKPFTILLKIGINATSLR
jgi:hypothetical protein